MENTIILLLLAGILAYAAYRGRKPYLRSANTTAPIPPPPQTGTAVAPVAATVQKKKWEWKKWEWLIPFMVWVIILVGLAINFSDQFWSWVWWTDHWKLVLVTNIVVLGFVMLWYNEAGKTGKRVATTALLFILALTYGTHYQWIPKDWKSWDLHEVQQALTFPPPVTKAFQSPVDHGVPWTPATNNGKSALLCVLKPGETSAFAPVGSRPFEFSADSNLIIAVNGKESFFSRDTHLSKQECVALGTYGKNRHTLRFKNPEKEPILVSVVFQ